MKLIIDFLVTVALFGSAFLLAGFVACFFIHLSFNLNDFFKGKYNETQRRNRKRNV